IGGGLAASLTLLTVSANAQTTVLKATTGPTPTPSFYCGYIDPAIYGLNSPQGDFFAPTFKDGTQPASYLIDPQLQSGVLVAAWYVPLDNVKDLAGLHYIAVAPDDSNNKLVRLTVTGQGSPFVVRVRIHLLCKAS